MTWSHCTERGTWSLDGAQLTLQPTSQAAEYSNQSGSQQKEDQDLGARRYELVDVTLESLERAGLPKQRLPGGVMSGPLAAWDTGSGDRLALSPFRSPRGRRASARGCRNAARPAATRAARCRRSRRQCAPRAR